MQFLLKEVRLRGGGRLLKTKWGQFYQNWLSSQQTLWVLRCNATRMVYPSGGTAKAIICSKNVADNMNPGLHTELAIWKQFVNTVMHSQ